MRIHAQRAVLALGLGLATLGAVGGTPARADFQAGVTAYTQGDYAAAAAQWRAAAADGDLAAMRNLGHLYRWGKGVDKDPAQAAEWYRRAAHQGLDRAMVNLAVLYLKGEGVTADPAAAAHWLGQAAAAGNADAMVRLADLLEHGEGVAADPVEARRLLTRAAALGHEEAAARLTGQPAPAVSGRTSEDMQETASAAAETSEATPASPPEPAPPAAQPAAPVPQAARVPADTAPALPPVRGPGTVEGTMIHMGAYRTRTEAELAWRDAVNAVPALADAEPYLLSGFVPGRGDLVRLYARTGSDPAMARLCADLTASGRACELHRFFK